MSVADWLLRPYEPGDEGFVVESWLISHGESSYSRHVRSLTGHDVDTYWNLHRPIVLRLLQTAQISVLCVPAKPEVILGWAASSGPLMLHYALCKRSLHREGLAAEAFGRLLGARLSRPQLVTHELVDLHKEPRITAPKTWIFAPYALAERATA